MAKLTLSDLASLGNPTSAIATINANNTALKNALENTLSRDGTSPNTMGADLDLNGHSLLNPGDIDLNGNRLTGLPESHDPTDAVTKQELDDAVLVGVDLSTINITGGTISGLTTPLAIADGGTGASSASAALTNLGGVAGPASSISSSVAIFSGTTGKVLADGNRLLPTGELVGTTATQTLTNKTLTAPAITSPTGLVKGDVGLGNVDNTTDLNKPVSTAQSALNATYVVGPASAIANSIAIFSDTSGKLLADGNRLLPTGALVGDSATQTLTNKTIDGSLNTITNVGRPVLTANRTYYVRTDGSNSNTGLVNSAGGAFLTIQKAIDTVSSLDISIYNVTISVGAGTFTGANTLKEYVGSGSVTISGAGATTIISVTSDNGFYGGAAGTWTLSNMKIQTTTSGWCLFLSGNTHVTTSGTFEVGTGASGHIRVAAASSLRLAAYTISGNAPLHYLAEYGGRITCVSVTVTLTGTPVFSSMFASAAKLAIMDLEAVTWSGSATGTRYLANLNSVINTVGGTLPGNAAGSVATGGQYT